jgi:glycosyltransferase involved in cell wall biosynthesis
LFNARRYNRTVQAASSQQDSQRPLRILHLAAASDAGGLSRYIHDLSSAMHDRGHDVRVAGARGAWHGLFEKAPFPWIDVPLSGGPLSLWKSIRALRKHLEAHPVDVLHTHYRRATLVARRLQDAPGRPPILYTVHLSHMPLKWPGKLWADFGDFAHVASEDAKDWTVNQAGMPADRVAVIPHGIHVERWPQADAAAKRAARERYDLSPDDRVACYVGRLDDPKNEDWLLDVAERLSELKLLVAGSGPHMEKFAQHVERRGLRDRVTLLGELADPLPVYQASDAFLLPSLREGFSFGCAEAMCVGVPVLRTRTSGTRELIVEGVTGRSCPIEHNAFVAAAVEFLRDGDALARMGRAAADHVREHLTFERQLAGTIALYRRLAGHLQTADNPNAVLTAAR